MKTRIHDMKFIKIKYKGVVYECHPDSWMARFKRPIQEFSEKELLDVIEKGI